MLSKVNEYVFPAWFNPENTTKYFIEHGYTPEKAKEVVERLRKLAYPSLNQETRSFLQTDFISRILPNVSAGILSPVDPIGEFVVGAKVVEGPIKIGSKLWNQ